MRKAFIDALMDCAKKDNKIMLITGDLGFRYLEPFAVAFPKQFLNIGVAESNLITVAGGLASIGYKPFVYSIATFASMRAYEQIRSVIALQNLSVRIVGIGGGLSYAKAGPTHHSIEDIGLMRLIPSMTIFNPMDPFECYAITKKLVSTKGPAYLRLETNPLENWYKRVPNFTVGKANILIKAKKNSKKKIAILTTGTKYSLGIQVSILMNKLGIFPTVVAFSTISPLDVVMLNKISDTHTHIATIEEHISDGGFGSIVNDYLTQDANPRKLIKFGLKGYSNFSGEYNNLLDYYSLTPQKIAKAIVQYE